MDNGNDREYLALLIRLEAQVRELRRQNWSPHAAHRVGATLDAMDRARGA